MGDMCAAIFHENAVRYVYDADVSKIPLQVMFVRLTMYSIFVAKKNRWIVTGFRFLRDDSF